MPRLRGERLMGENEVWFFLLGVYLGGITSFLALISWGGSAGHGHSL